MDAEKFFKEMYFFIWQSHGIERFDEFYAKDFEETISVTNDQKQPVDLHMDYHHLLEQARWQKEEYQDTTLEIKKVVGSANYISVHFYSRSFHKRSGEWRHRCVCGIWRLNQERKIDRVWAVVTPYYA